ncbi:MAG: hypothetical protein U1E11_08295, partial [Dethiobacteria bacterium]|nr:hypothetical protein [Dethiobacteria bacterium]
RSGPAIYAVKSGGKAFGWDDQDERQVNQIALGAGQVYLATSQGGLILDKSDSLKIYRYDGKSPVEMDGELLGVAVDGPYVWWLSGDVLLRYDRRSASWEKYPRAGNYNAGRSVCLAVDDNNPHSTMKCNKGSCFKWCFKAQTFSGPVVEFIFNFLYPLIGNHTKVGTLWQVSSDKAVYLFVRSSFPGVVRMGKVALGFNG